MPAMKPVSRRTLMVMMAGFVTGTRSLPAAAAGEGDNPNQLLISITVPDFSGDPASDDATPRNIAEIINSELKASGRLVLIGSHGLVEDNIDAIPQFDKWRSIHTANLVTGHVTHQPDQHIAVQFRLWDVATGQHLVGAQYWLPPENWQGVAHAIAQAVLERLIGRT